MVYCGKPSRGCQMCRTRRIKCDEARPTCNQCAKSRRQCPGYKDEFDLVFRNETQATERRAKKASRKLNAGKLGKEGLSPLVSEVGSSVSPTFKESSNSPTASSIFPMLGIPVDQQASCHFVSNFVLVPRQDGTRGFMDYLIPLMRSEGVNSPLANAFKACAFASLGNRPNASRSGIADRALTIYNDAIQSLQVSLMDPEAARSDATLAAVLLLGLYENITAKEMGMLSWGRHIEGAIQLCKARGRKQLRTKLGLVLFITVRTQMIVHSLTSGKAPVMGVDWWVNDAVKDEIASHCQQLNIRTCELRAEVTRLMTTVTRNPENIELMLDMTRRAQMVDREVVNWMRDLPDYWQYKTVAWEDHVPNGDYSKAEVYPGRVDVYTDFWIASVWNMARVSRISLASLIVRCAAWVCSPVDYRTTPEYATAARTCVDTITDILASAPYNLGWHLKRPDILQKNNLSEFACGEENCQKSLAGYFLTFPLALVHGQDYCTDAQRAWVSGRLKYIGDEMGVKYAHILRQLHVRIPSMLIRRDGLMAQPYPMAHNFEKLVSARFAPPTTGYSMNPLQQREAMQKERVSQEKAELLQKAVGTAGQAGEWVAKTWLTV